MLTRQLMENIRRVLVAARAIFFIFELENLSAERSFLTATCGRAHRVAPAKSATRRSIRKAFNANAAILAALKRWRRPPTSYAEPSNDSIAIQPHRFRGWRRPKTLAPQTWRMKRRTETTSRS